MICVFNHAGCIRPCSVFSRVWSDRMAICVHPCALHHQDVTLSCRVRLKCLCSSGELGAMTRFRLFLERIKTSKETYIPIAERRASNCRFHTKVGELHSDYLQLSVSSWSRWGGRWPSHSSESPGGAVFFTTELLGGMKWKGNVSKVKAIWRAHPPQLHVSGFCKAPQDSLDSYRRYINKHTLNWIWLWVMCDVWWLQNKQKEPNSSDSENQHGDRWRSRST